MPARGSAGQPAIPDIGPVGTSPFGAGDDGARRIGVAAGGPGGDAGDTAAGAAAVGRSQGWRADSCGSAAVGYCGGAGSCPMQITVQLGAPGAGGWDGHIGSWGDAADGPRSISGICASGSVDGRPTLSGKPGPIPAGFSRCISPSGGAGPVTGGRSAGTTPVAYAAAQPSTFWAYGMELL